MSVPREKVVTVHHGGERAVFQPSSVQASPNANSSVRKRAFTKGLTNNLKPSRVNGFLNFTAHSIDNTTAGKLLTPQLGPIADPNYFGGSNVCDTDTDVPALIREEISSPIVVGKGVFPLKYARLETQQQFHTFLRLL